jgi:hypothetical protein
MAYPVRPAQRTFTDTEDRMPTDRLDAEVPSLTLPTHFSRSLQAWRQKNGAA